MTRSTEEPSGGEIPPSGYLDHFFWQRSSSCNPFACCSLRRTGLVPFRIVFVLLETAYSFSFTIRFICGKKGKVEVAS